ncbi:WecB/TagA/CpsF family glycosyltransferase [Candidatus Margulisiibacteriota bacterium]
MSKLKKNDILGIKVCNMTMPQAVAKVSEFVESMRPHLVVTPNPEIIVSSANDSEIKDILNNAALALPDGVGVTLAGKVLERPFCERVPGIELMENAVRQAAEKNYGVYLLGASPAVVQVAAANLRKKHPALRVLGTMHGYFKTEEEEQEVIDDILDAAPDILFVGMGSPRQEKWAAKHLQKLRVPVIICVGGSFDVISGYLKRAPLWMQRLCIEWLYRLFQEPKRWKRILVLPWFLWKVFEKKRNSTE